MSLVYCDFNDNFHTFNFEDETYEYIGIYVGKGTKPDGMSKSKGLQEVSKIIDKPLSEVKELLNCNCKNKTFEIKSKHVIQLDNMGWVYFVGSRKLSEKETFDLLNKEKAYSWYQSLSDIHKSYFETVAKDHFIPKS